VYSGHDNGELCDTELAVETLATYKDDEITYCLVVTNTGNTHLNKVVVVDPPLSFRDAATIRLMAPGDKVILHVTRSADRDRNNTAMVTAVR
jgi:subtilisin-like proprotein convertase family protein